MPYPTVLKTLEGETRTHTISFEDELPTGLGFAASGHTVTATNHWSGVTDNTILNSTTPTVSGTDVSFVTTGLLLGERYDVTLTMRGNDATPSVLPQTFLLICVENLD